VIESDGTRLLDAMSGLFTTQIGYSHGAELGAAAAAQMERLAYYPNWAATNPATLALTERVLGLAPPQMARVFFTSGGSESVESAWKLARQHFQARGESTRRIVISRHGSYHGCSLGALSITGIPSARAPFEPLLSDTRHVMNTDPRQNPTGDPLAAADAFEQAILAEGAENVCMVILEPVQNAGGCLVPPPGYAQRVREICDRHGVLLCCDEVICAFGRLGHWFGSERLGFEPDLITFAKGVTSGYAPLGGVIFSEKVAAPLLEVEGLYAHGYTFGGHPVSCATALANIAVMERIDVLANVLDVEPYLEGVLDEVAAASPIAVEARGCGFFRALELVDAALCDSVRAATRARGVIVRTDVRANPCLAISPPLISDRSQVDELAEALAGGLAEIAG
jgi:adenosylmethionine-8-amino-7-oxononanoate aminotransferase